MKINCPHCNQEIDLHQHDAEVRESMRNIVETIVRRTAQANCPEGLNVQTAMMEFDATMDQCKET